MWGLELDFGGSIQFEVGFMTVNSAYLFIRGKVRRETSGYPYGERRWSI